MFGDLIIIDASKNRITGIRIYVPHWGINNYFTCCKNARNNVCPLTPNDTMCPTVMYRALTARNSIYKISMCSGARGVGQLPKNY